MKEGGVVRQREETLWKTGNDVLTMVAGIGILVGL
jgi:hypothetical protein